MTTAKPCSRTHRYTVGIPGQISRYTGPDEAPAIEALLSTGTGTGSGTGEEGYVTAEHEDGSTCPAEADCIADAAETAADLNETVIHDGLTWCAEGPKGKLWTIIWQPARAEDNIRAWPFPAGRTKHWGAATEIAAARREAVRIAGLIADGKVS